MFCRSSGSMTLSRDFRISSCVGMDLSLEGSERPQTLGPERSEGPPPLGVRAPARGVPTAAPAPPPSAAGRGPTPGTRRGRRRRAWPRTRRSTDRCREAPAGRRAGRSGSAPRRTSRSPAASSVARIRTVRCREPRHAQELVGRVGQRGRRREGVGQRPVRRRERAAEPRGEAGGGGPRRGDGDLLAQDRADRQLRAVRRAGHPDARCRSDERGQRGVARQHRVGLVARGVEREQGRAAPAAPPRDPRPPRATASPARRARRAAPRRRRCRRAAAGRGGTSRRPPPPSPAPRAARGAR